MTLWRQSGEQIDWVWMAAIHHLDNKISRADLSQMWHCLWHREVLAKRLCRVDGKHMALWNGHRVLLLMCNTCFHLPGMQLRRGGGGSGNSWWRRVSITPFRHKRTAGDVLSELAYPLRYVSPREFLITHYIISETLPPKVVAIHIKCKKVVLDVTLKLLLNVQRDSNSC